MAKIVAYAWQSGLIEFGNTCPDGALPIMTGKEKEVRDAITVLARYSRKNDDLLVPGIPEARNADEELAALVSFVKSIKNHQGK